MNPELETLARRAVACKHWRWIEGMLTERGDRIASVEHDSLIVLDEEFEIVELTDGKAIPDLRDPATVGCLLALVREALKPRVWGFTLCLANTGAGWQLGYLAGGEWFSPLGTIHRSEVKALVSALEGAP